MLIITQIKINCMTAISSIEDVTYFLTLYMKFRIFLSNYYIIKKTQYSVSPYIALINFEFSKSSILIFPFHMSYAKELFFNIPKRAFKDH